MTTFKRTCVSALPILVLLAGCGNDLESRNAAAGVQEGSEDDLVITRQTPRGGSSDSGEVQRIDELEEVEEIADDFAVISAPDADTDIDTEDGEEEGTIVDASPDDLRDMAQGFSPEPLDDASGIDPTPIAPSPVDE